jgi:hypothetical protein
LAHTAPPLRPATLLRLRSIPFTSFVCFWPLRFCEDQKQPKPAEGEQKMKLEDIKTKTKDAVDYLVQSCWICQSHLQPVTRAGR